MKTMSAKSLAARRHNGLFGHLAMSRQAMWAIIQSPTTNQEAKSIARAVVEQLDDLKDHLKERIDP